MFASYTPYVLNKACTIQESSAWSWNHKSVVHAVIVVFYEGESGSEWQSNFSS